MSFGAHCRLLWLPANGLEPPTSELSEPPTAHGPRSDIAQALPSLTSLAFAQNNQYSSEQVGFQLKQNEL